MQPAKLAALVARSGRPIYTVPEDVRLATRGLVGLSGYFTSHGDLRLLSAPVRKFARRNAPDTIGAVLRDAALVDPSDPTSGRRFAFALRALPTNTSISGGSGGGAEAVYDEALAVATAALTAGAWPLADLLAALVTVRRRGGYGPPLGAALAALVRSRAATATADEVSSLVALAALLPEVYTADRTVVDAAAARAALLADELTPAAIGAVCGALNRAGYCGGGGGLAVALQEEADRIAQGCEARAAIEVLLFVARHKAKYVSADSLQWLLERVAGEPLDATAALHLCWALRALPLLVKEALRADLADLVAHVATQVAALLADMQQRAGGSPSSSSLVSSEGMQLLLSSFLRLHTVLVPALAADSPAMTAYSAAADACAGYVTGQADAIAEAGADALPTALVESLLQSPSPRVRACGAALLREAARECADLPALQAFRFLLLLADGNGNDSGDREVALYLRGRFSKTAANVPPAQLCTALRCFIVCCPPTAGGVTGDEVDAEREGAEAAAFLRFATETARGYFAGGLPVRLSLALTEALYRLGCRDEAFFEEAAAFLDTRVAAATPRVHSADAAATVCLALGEDLLDQRPDLHSFLLGVEAVGPRGEALLSPAAWMDLHDPANAIAPLTEQQQESWDILERMSATRADDRAALLALAAAYLRLLPHARPDDHKYFFGVFEEKVLKEDRLLKECLDALGASGITAKLSAATIGGILDSCATLRFAYPRSTRRFVEGVSAEQWAEMEGSPLVQVLAAMARLSLRMPPQLDAIGRRLAALARFLSPRDVADAIRAFQTLGYSDEAVMGALVACAAARAGSFDEASLTTLFSAPAVHRLLRSPEVAGPLLRRACGVVSSPQQRQRIAAKVGRFGVSRDVLASCAAELAMLGGPGAVEALRLT